MDEGKAEIYKFIRDQHDKLVTARESLISRYGNIRLLAGLLLTVISFSLGITTKAIDDADSLPYRIVAFLPLIFLGLAFYYIIKALLAVPDMVGNIHTNIPIPDKEKFEMGLADDDLDADNILKVLSSNYLNTIRRNLRVLKFSRRRLRKGSQYIRRGLCTTIIFLIVAILANVIVTWRLYDFIVKYVSMEP